MLQNLSEVQEENGERALIDERPYRLTAQYANMRISSSNWVAPLQKKDKEKSLCFVHSPQRFPHKEHRIL